MLVGLPPILSTPTPLTSRKDFYRRCLEQLSRKPPYVWNGKSMEGLDCSGFVTLALYVASDKRTDWRKTHNTDSLWLLTTRIEAAQVRPGDLVLYFGEKSTGPRDVSHVMVCAGEGLCFGQAYGGPSDTDPVASRQLGKVTQVKPIGYRPDLAGFVRLPLV